MNENVKKYLEMSRRLESMIDETGEGGPEADRLRDEMDPLWVLLTPADLKEIEEISRKERIMNVTETTFQSKWGFHPCDRETFKKLKAIKKAYWQAVYDFYNWWRWERKEPQNRQGPEPKYNNLFVINKLWCKTSQRKDKDGNVHTHYRYFPRTVTDHGFLALYEQARKPNSELVEPFSEETLKKIDEFYAKL